MKYISLLSLLVLILLVISCGKDKSSNQIELQSEDTIANDTLNRSTDDEVDSLLHQENKDTINIVKEKAISEDSTFYDSDYRYENTYIYISKPKMRLYVLNKNDSVLFSCGIACGLRKGNKTGKGDFRTPEGHFHVAGIYESTNWIHKTRSGRKVKGCYGPYFLSLATGRFTGIGIHGTNAPHSIGKRASEGCIRVNTKNIIYIKNHYAYAGMPVVVSGEREYLPNFDGLGQESRDVNLQKNSSDSLTSPVSTVDSVQKVTADSVFHRSKTVTQGSDSCKSVTAEQHEKKDSLDQ